jgi:hypothetical protein
MAAGAAFRQHPVLESGIREKCAVSPPGTGLARHVLSLDKKGGIFKVRLHCNDKEDRDEGTGE